MTVLGRLAAGVFVLVLGALSASIVGWWLVGSLAPDWLFWRVIDRLELFAAMCVAVGAAGALLFLRLRVGRS